MKVYYYILMILLLGCNSDSKNKQSNKSQESIVKQKSYFDFDEIEYYNNPIAESEFIQVLKNSRKSEGDSIKSGLLLFNIPKSLLDTSFISKLEEVNYKKKSIDPSKFAEINQIFSEKPAKDQLTTSCDPMYRNILIFRKKHSLVGIAKICFACMYHQIVGTSADTQNFGQDGDYEKLRTILFK